MNARLLLAAIVLCCTSLRGQQVPAAIAADPAVDEAHPAAFDAFQIVSHGAKLNAIAYIAAGAGPHPVVILLHGFPGNEKNLDLAQAMRRAGWDVLFFNYRGSWGSPGTFSLTHCMEDAEAAIAYLRDPVNAARLRSDPKKIVLVGHSMGGGVAANVGARDPGIRATALISAANMTERSLAAIKSGHSESVVAPLAKSLEGEGMAPLAGCTPESLARDWIANAEKWNLPDLAGQLGTRPALIVTSDDGFAPASDALAANLRAKKFPVTALHLATDHSYSDQRVALEIAVIHWLDTLAPPAATKAAASAAFDATLAQSHRALEAILNGNPKLYEALFADRDDITLGNPFGPFGIGRAQVSAALHNAAAKYHDGQVVGVDLVARYGDDTFITVVEIEHDLAKVGASEQFAEFNVRVSSTYERIHGDWKLIHRHADPITTARPAESVLQK